MERCGDDVRQDIGVPADRWLARVRGERCRRAVASRCTHCRNADSAVHLPEWHGPTLDKAPTRCFLS
ncbi:hypothetical protein BRL98_06540, partial [Xanthomonas oryzae pv. oryzae]